jgi:glycosyltransferase involved in cell wall biosynthesis
MVVRRALCQRPEDWIVSVIGQVIPCKEVEVAIEAVAALPVLAGRSVQLAIVGDFQDVEPDWSDGLRRMAWARLGPRARFVPKREDIEEVLRSSDVVVSAARGEAFGRSVLEAQACGVPTIGVRGSGTEEMISDWETGLLFSPGSASELARCIEIFCGDDALRATVTRRARDAATVRFSAEAVGSRTAAVYEDMVRAHRPRHRGPDRVGVPRRIVRRLAETERGRGKSDAGGAWTA